MDWLVVSPWLLAGLFFVAVLSGFIDTLAATDGLITIPTLRVEGLFPAHVLATNKLQSVGGCLSASLYFIRRGTVKLADQKRNIAMTLLEAVAGTVLNSTCASGFVAPTAAAAGDSDRSLYIRLAIRSGGRRLRVIFYDGF